MKDRRFDNPNDSGNLLRNVARRIEEMFGTTRASQRLQDAADYYSQYAEPLSPFDRHRPSETYDPQDLSEQ